MTGLPSRGSAGRTQAIRLGILILVLAGVLAYRYWPAGERPATSERTPVARTARVGTPGGTPGVLPRPAEVRLDTLHAPPNLADADRNPFTFGVRPPPPPPPQEDPAPVFVPVPAPQRPQGPPPIPLRLMGITIAPGSARSMVTLTEPATHGVYHAFEGDIVDGRFRVVRVGVQSVVLSYLDGSGTRTIALGG